MTTDAIRQQVAAAGFTVTDVEQRGQLYRVYVKALPVTTAAALEGRFPTGAFRGHGIDRGGNVNRVYIMLKEASE